MDDGGLLRKALETENARLLRTIRDLTSKNNDYKRSNLVLARRLDARERTQPPEHVARTRAVEETLEEMDHELMIAKHQRDAAERGIEQCESSLGKERAHSAELLERVSSLRRNLSRFVSDDISLARDMVAVAKGIAPASELAALISIEDTLDALKSSPPDSVPQSVHDRSKAVFTLLRRITLSRLHHLDGTIEALKDSVQQSTNGAGSAHQQIASLKSEVKRVEEEKALLQSETRASLSQLRELQTQQLSFYTAQYDDAVARMTELKRTNRALMDDIAALQMTDKSCNPAPMTSSMRDPPGMHLQTYRQSVIHTAASQIQKSDGLEPSSPFAMAPENQPPCSSIPTPLDPPLCLAKPLSPKHDRPHGGLSQSARFIRKQTKQSSTSTSSPDASVVQRPTGTPAHISAILKKYNSQSGSRISSDILRHSNVPRRRINRQPTASDRKGTTGNATLATSSDKRLLDSTELKISQLCAAAAYKLPIHTAINTIPNENTTAAMLFRLAVSGEVTHDAIASEMSRLKESVRN